ncbi:hypothetical protein D3C85_981770 [compost metagenome]
MEISKARIVYQPENGPVAILIPCECGLTLEQIGQKDVPNTLPFWIISAADIPADRTDRDAWELDPATMGEPAGEGTRV